MGRNKISIELKDYRTRQFSFYKRRTGLLKKAMELSIPCGVDIFLHIAISISPKDNVFFFSSRDCKSMLQNAFNDCKGKKKNVYFKNDYHLIFGKGNSNTTSPSSALDEKDNCFENQTNYDFFN